MNEEYVKKLEGIIKTMIKPLKEIPLDLVMESLTGCKILPFDSNSDKDLKVLETLKKVANNVCLKFNNDKVKRSRPNEIGNDIEPYVIEELNKLNYKAKSPKTNNGITKSVGYPDIEFTDEFGRTNYLECKTFNILNIKTTQRSFYLSPSENSKITQDAHHFVISFEVYKEKTIKGLSLYKCKSWKILSIEKLEVDVKYEFNANNKNLYSTDMILAEDSIK